MTAFDAFKYTGIAPVNVDKKKDYSTIVRYVLLVLTTTPLSSLLLETGYLPKHNSKDFRIAQTNNNILPGVADPEAIFDEKMHAILNQWVGEMLSTIGSRPVALLLLVEQTPSEVKIYHSHIGVRSDPQEKPGSSWGQKFVPHDVPLAMVRLVLACTDWLYELNKHLR
ncbi:hypothetical protein HOY82DRAFT_610003 [Tuber indicum]|nr:hypothetical protein HOY82DRAFT_610003 [Tuber indicum]